MASWPRFIEYSNVYGYSLPVDPVLYYIQTTQGTISVRKNMVKFPIGMHIKERMEHEDVIASEKRRTIGIMPRYSAYFQDEGVWYEITYEGKEAKPVEETTKMKQYDFNNAVIMNFKGVRFVKDGNSLYHLKPIEWRDEQKKEWTKSDWGFFDLGDYTEIKISNNLIVRFSADGYEEIVSPNTETMVNEIVEKLYDDGVLLEWKTSLNALLPDRVMRLGCEELRTLLVRADMITPVHSSRECILYKITKDHWDSMATSFVKSNPNDIERIYNEICKK